MQQILHYWYVFVILFAGAFAALVYSVLSPMRHMIKGNYEQAIAKMRLQLVSASYSRKPLLKASLLLNLANCFNRQGSIEQSLATLAEIDLSDIDDERFLFGYYGLYATNLVLQDEESERAAHMLHKAYALLPVPEILPLLAYSEASRRNHDRAEWYLSEYLSYTASPKNATKKFIWSVKETTLVFDEFTMAIENNFYVGMAYLKLGHEDLARTHLSLAVKAEHPNYYSAKAREVLSGLQHYSNLSAEKC